MNKVSRALFLLLLPLASTAAADPAAVSTSTLTMADAISRALDSNINVRISTAKNERVRGTAVREAADLLPQITGSARQARVYKVNLEAQGFNFPGMNPLIGPFSTFDARIRLSQKLFDIASIDRARSAGAARRMSEAELALARENVAAAASLAYLEALRSKAAVTSAQAGATLARTLQKQVENQRQAGAAAAIDVARGRTRSAEEDLRVLQAQSQENDAMTRLKRITGLPLGNSLELSDPFVFTAQPAIDLTAAISTATASRPEMGMAAERERSLRLALSAAKWTRAPAVSANGDYGASGNNIGNSHGTGSIGLNVDMPLITSGRLTATRIAAEADLDEAESQKRDVAIQVEEDVRLAVDQLATSALQVKTADQAVALARSELQMARDRFEAGVGSNVDVVNAQTALARVEDAQIAALAGYQSARINYAMALGEAEKFRL